MTGTGNNTIASEKINRKNNNPVKRQIFIEKWDAVGKSVVDDVSEIVFLEFRGLLAGK
jgi:hypothetical protein